MFHFKRRTLWIIIYLSIPLIFILNQLGPDSESVEQEPESVRQSWSMDNISAECESKLRFCLLSLEGAEGVSVSAILNQMPADNLEIPASANLNSVLQRGAFVVTLESEPSRTSRKAAIEFLEQWLPYEGWIWWVISGDLTLQEAKAWLPDQKALEGGAVPITIESAAALSVLTAPSIGHPDQLAFLMWIEVLKQRLDGYSVRVTWDHRREESLILINQTLAEDSFGDVTDQELAPILTAYQATAAQRDRNQSQLHRYLVTAMNYTVPFDYFIDQPQRLAEVTLESVNRMRDFSFEQIQKTKD